VTFIYSIPIEATKGMSTSEAAKTVGVTKRTLLQWIYKGLLKEPKQAKVAGVAWRIWSADDIQRAKKVKSTIKRGPKPKMEGKKSPNRN
jgi:excisionase family DNA binding protein